MKSSSKPKVFGWRLAKMTLQSMRSRGLDQAKFLAIDARLTLGRNRFGQQCKGGVNVRVIAVGDDGGSLVATFTKRHVERHLTEQRNTEFVGQLLTTTGTEDVVPLPVVADKPTHVLDNTTNGEL